MFKIILSLILLCVLFESSDGHGYTLEPPGRSTLWRHPHRFPKAPINYDDNGLNCGGFGIQWSYNAGKCGICGDPYHSPIPRNNEDGGQYGRGIIGATYKAGQAVNITIVVTANHHGWFEFRLCNDSDRMKTAPERCFDENLLQLIDGSGTRYHIPDKTASAFKVNIGAKLPNGLVCSRCVLQWHWNTATNWGICSDGTGRMGCGRQEVFRACSDISIIA